MPGATIGTQLNYGYPGNYARTPDQIIRTYPVSEGEIFYGQAVMRDGGKVKPFAAGTAIKDFLGIAVRRVMSATSYLDQNQVSYQSGGYADIMQRGAISVEVAAGDPSVGGAVFIRAATGEIVAADEGADTIALTNCEFASGKDSRDVAELVILERTGA